MIGRLVRRRLFWVIATFSTAVLLYLAFAVFGVQALFVNKEVNEEFAVTTPATEETAAPQEGTMNDEEQSASAEPAAPVRISSGRFHPVTHEGEGDAIVYRLEDGSYVLRLENFDVFNGPDLYVYAVAAGDANDAESVLDAGFVNVGRLKGNRGNQTYALPAGFDPQKHQAISIWCRRFTVNFATAPLRHA
jgi:hypothetical protein